MHERRLQEDTAPQALCFAARTAKMLFAGKDALSLATLQQAWTSLKKKPLKQTQKKKKKKNRRSHGGHSQASAAHDVWPVYETD